MTTRFPLLAVVMELGAVMKRRRIRGHVQWGNANHEPKGGLSSERTAVGFRSEQEAPFQPWDYRSEVFQDALQLGAELQRSPGQGLTRATAPGAVKRHKKAPLKEREPW